MTTAAQGVQKALARAGASVIAIAEMSSADLIAQMTDEQKSALAASLTPTPAPSPAGAAASEPGTEAEPDDKKKTEAVPGEEGGAAASTFASVNARFQTVVASEHYAGNETLAHALLGNDKLTASEITTALAAVRKPEAGASAEQVAAANEEGQRAGMKAALAQTQNSSVEPGGAGNPSDRQKADAVWSKAYGIKE